MVQLPIELWLHILDFLSDDTLNHLLGVNSFFFDVAMNARYKTIELQTLNPTTNRYLSRLSDANVSKRVREITVSPDFQNYGTTKPQSTLEHLGSVLQSALFGLPLTPEDQATKRLINILPGLINVRNFTIDCHSWGSHSTSQLNNFLDTSWSSFGHNIRKLSLRGHASAFKTIIHSTVIALPALTELFLELIDNPLQSDPAAPKTLLETIAPFINGLASQIKVFTLWSWGTVDLSLFFAKLNRFPQLTEFNLQTSFPKTFRVDPSGLSRFLENHASHIECLVLRLNIAPLSLRFDTTSEIPLSEWMLNTFSRGGWRFKKLNELHLYPTVLPGGFDALVACIEQSSDTLRKLVVRDRYLSQEETMAVINALPPETKALRMNVRIMNIELFEQAAKRLGGLKSLTLLIGAVDSTFDTDMKERSFAGWPLRHIGIWHSGAMLDSHLMTSISRSIPSLIYFWGEKNWIEDFGRK